MTQKESLLIETLINEDEKLVSDPLVYGTQELTSWHKSHPSDLGQNRSINLYKPRYLPILTQRIKSKPTVLKANINLKSSIFHKVPSSIYACKSTRDSVSLNPIPNKDNLTPSEPLLLDTLLLKLKEMPNKSISKLSPPNSLKPYKNHIKTSSLVPSPSHPKANNSFHQSENIRKVIGLTFDSTNITSCPQNRLSFHSKPLSPSYFFSKVKKFPTFPQNSDTSKSNLYGMLNLKQHKPSEGSK